MAAVTAWSGRPRQPEGTITRAWLDSPAPVGEPTVVGIECGEPGCRSIIVGTSRAEAERRLADHVRRRHGA